MSNVVKQIKPQAKRVDQKLKSKILREILLPNSSIPKIAKNYDLSSTTLYGWRLDHIKKLSKDLKNKEELSEISITLNNNISLSLKGNINSFTLIKIINSLEEEVC